MAAISIVNTRDFLSPLDFDPEHYHPDRISSLALLKQNSSKVIANFFENIIQLRAASPIIEPSPVFDLTDALGCFLNNGEICTELISTKKVARPNDIIISRLRSYLQELCFVPQRSKNSYLLSTEFIVLRSHIGNSGAWLLPFLLSKQVQTVLHWSQTGSNHPRFAVYTLMNIPVPDQILSLRERLSRIVESGVQQFEQSQLLYPEAEAELLERMRWKELAKYPVELYYIEKFSETEKHGRVDPEHFHPKYKRIQTHLQKAGAKYLGDFCPIPHRGVQPNFVEGGKVFVIDSKAVRPQGVEPSASERTDIAFYNRESNVKARILQGDVLLNSTGRGTLGRAACYHMDNLAIADNHVAIIRPDKKICLPVYLSLFLNSPAGLAQSEMYQTGSSGQLELYPQHIHQFLIYLPKNKSGEIDLEWQEKLANKVIAASAAKAEAQAKLEKAIQLVEEAIHLK